LERVLATHPEDDVVVAASLRLAELQHERLERLDAARRALDTVLTKRADHPEALRRLLAIQLATKDTAAPETARRLAEVSPDPAVRAAAWPTLGRLPRQRKDLESACSAYAEAIAIVGLSEAAATELKELLVQRRVAGNQPAWAEYAGALIRYMNTPGCEPEAFAAVALELARVQADELAL